jgi:aminopeptidase N
LTSSKNFLFFANGLLEKEEINGDLKTSHWNCDFICPSYLICFAIGDFIIVEDESFENIPITYIAPKGTLKEDLKLTFEYGDFFLMVVLLHPL